MEYTDVKPSKSFYLLGVLLLIIGGVILINQFLEIASMVSNENNLQTNNEITYQMKKDSRLLVASIANVDDANVTYDNTTITVEYYSQITTISYFSVNSQLEIELMPENIRVDIDSYSGLFYIKALEDDILTISTNAPNNYYKALNNFNNEFMIMLVLKLIGGFFIIAIGFVIEILTYVIRKSSKKKLLEKPNYY